MRTLICQSGAFILFFPATGQHGDTDRIMTLHSLYNTLHSQKLTTGTSANAFIARAYMVLSEEFVTNKLPVHCG